MENDMENYMNNFSESVLEEFLIEITNKNGTKRCAEESYKILDNQNHSELLKFIIASKFLHSKKLIPQHIKDFEEDMINLFINIYKTNQNILPIQFLRIFESEENNITEKVKKSIKLNYAIYQFVSVFNTIDEFESNYPEITKEL